MQKELYTQSPVMPIPLDPREQSVPFPTRHAVEQARADAAKESLQAICDGFSDGFLVLLQHDRLCDVFGAQVLRQAFNDLLTERRRS